MSESADYDPGPWRGHDFASARAHYDAHSGRSYGTAKSTGIVASDLVPDKIKTESTSPLVILCDVTGSMGEWPTTIFSKLPYLEHEAKDYLGADCEIAFGAVGDGFSDHYPLQVRQFTSSLELKQELEALVVEGNGGGSSQESYETAALYYARNVEMPRAVQPILIFIGDEQPYDRVETGHGDNIAKVHLQKPIDTVDVFEELKRKYATYIVRKRYDGHNDHEIHNYWKKLLGDDHIAMLQDPGRVVDVIFGILAKESGRIDDFRDEIEGRQTAEQVDTVYKALTTVHRGLTTGRKALPKGRSTLHGKSGGKKSKSLL